MHNIMFRRFSGLLLSVLCACGTSSMLHTQESNVYIGKPDSGPRIKIYKQPKIVWEQHVSDVDVRSNALLIRAVVDMILDLNHFNKLDKESVCDVFSYIASQLLNVDIIREQITHRNYDDLDYDIYRILKEILIEYDAREIHYMLEKEAATIAEVFLSDIKQGDEIMNRRWRLSYEGSSEIGNSTNIKNENDFKLYTLDGNLLDDITAKIYNYINRQPQLKDNRDIETLMLNLSADSYLQQWWNSGYVYSPQMRCFFHQYMKEKEDYKLYIALLSRALVDLDDRHIMILDSQQKKRNIESFNDLVLHWIKKRQANIQE